MASLEDGNPSLLRVARPLLPTLERIAPLLAEIDRNRWYSNFGPLAERFAAALGVHFGTPAGAPPLLVANATIGLSLCLSAVARPGARFCLVPAWTFVATAHAVQRSSAQISQRRSATFFSHITQTRAPGLNPSHSCLARRPRW